MRTKSTKSIKADTGSVSDMNGSKTTSTASAIAALTKNVTNLEGLIGRIAGRAVPPVTKPVKSAGPPPAATTYSEQIVMLGNRVAALTTQAAEIAEHV